MPAQEVSQEHGGPGRPDTPVENDRLFRRDLFLLQLQAARRRRPTPLRIVAQRSVRVISSTR